MICTKRSTVLNLAAPNHLRGKHIDWAYFDNNFGWGLHNYREQSTREDYSASVVRTFWGAVRWKVSLWSLQSIPLTRGWKRAREIAATATTCYRRWLLT